MDVRIAAAKAVASLRRDGIGATARKAVRHFAPHDHSTDVFDIVHGTDTGGIIPSWKLGINSQNSRFAEKYQASDPDELNDAIVFSGVRPSGLSFIDLGCGKGRTLIVAAELGFRRVIGIDFVPSLVDIARVNLNKLGLDNKSSVLCIDASSYKFPDDKFILYLYNPFTDSVMQPVIDNLTLSRTEVVSVVYKHPLCAELFNQCDFLECLGSPPNNADIIVWRRCDSES